MLVMDENRHFNCSAEYVRQLEWLIRRDRNHPSVILWSVFNEEPMQGCETGYEMVRRMSAVVKRLDPTRPVTAAMNGGLFDPVNVSQAVDVVGFNYQTWAYDRFHSANPNMLLTSAEDTSAFMIRGEYCTDRPRNIIDAYDSECAPWGATHREGWKAIAQRPYLAGGFIWTGFDYHGEPTPLIWPTTSSVFGCLDLCGFPKTGFYIHQAHWLTDRTVLQIVPHWNWPGREGQAIKVMVLSNAASVELRLNGRSLGEQPVDPMDMVSWKVPYAPGRLEAIARQDGRILATALVETTGAAVALRLTPDRASMAGDGVDAQPVTVEAVDAQGRAVPTANLPVSFEVGGPGRLVGLGNGDPNSHEPEQGNRRSLFNGLAQVILQTQQAAGVLVLRACAEGVASAEVAITIAAVPARPAVPKTAPVFALRDWRLSPLATAAIDPNVEVADNDMNSWSAQTPGTLQMFTGGTWAVYRARFVPYAAVRQGGGRILFHGITGRAEIWLDRQKVAVKESFAVAPLTVELPAGEGERVLSLLLEAQPDAFAGLGQGVEVRM
jgi:beta-galactosidase